MQISLKHIIEELEKLDKLLEFEYTEEPDAFETQSEKELNDNLERKIDASILQGNKPTVKEAILQNLYQHFCNYKFLRDVQLIGDRVQFWMPSSKWYWLFQWEENSDALKQANLHVYRYNSSEGYIVEIQ